MFGKRGSWTVVLAFVVLVFGCATSPAPEANTEVLTEKVGAPGEERYSDPHAHIIDFLQNGEFDNRDGRFEGVGERGRIRNSRAVRYLSLPYGEQWRRLTLLLSDMDAAGVDHQMICGLPLLKKWSANEPFARPRYYLDSSSRLILARDTDFPIGAAVLDYRRQFADQPEKLAELGRIYPFVCGFDGTDLGAVDLVIKRIKQFPGVWMGVGEVMSRHDDMTNLTLGERPRANHPALKRLCRFAGEKHLPVSIHHNIAPVSRSSREVKDPLYLDELVELFEYCRPPAAKVETKFIWAHAGISRRVVVGDLVHWLDSVLSRFGGQVSIDLSWVVYEDYIAKDIPAWARLVRKYPYSFMLGSDVVGGGRNLGKELARYRPLLDAISKDPNDAVRKNLAVDNFANLMKDLKAKQRAVMIREKLITADAPAWTGLILRSDYEYAELADTGAAKDSFLERNRP